MSEENQIATLRFKIQDDSWSAPSETIWQKILEIYLFEIGDCFGLRGITSVEDLRRNTIFNFVDNFQTRILRTKRYSPGTISLLHDPKTYTEEIALFELNSTAKRALAFAPYGHWFFEKEFTGVQDELNFFAGASHLAMTVDSDVIFYNLNKEYYELLCAADSSIAKNLWSDSKMKTVYQPR